MMLVVGAGGFVGSAITRAAVEAGEEVVSLVRLPTGGGAAPPGPDDVVTGDARLPGLGLGPAVVTRLRRSVTTVVVATGRPALGAALSALRRDHLVPLAGALAFARQCRGLRQVVLLSSVAAAGSRQPGLRSDRLPARPRYRTHYEYVKAEAERLVRASGLPWCAVRAGHVMAAEAGDHLPPVPVGIFELLPHLAAAGPLLVDPDMTYWCAPVDFVGRLVIEVARRPRLAVWAVDPASPPLTRVLDALAVHHGLGSRRLLPTRASRAVAELVPSRWWGTSTPGAFRQYAGAEWKLDLRCLGEMVAAGLRPPRSLDYVDRTLDHEVARLGRLGRGPRDAMRGAAR
jgi:nucleoside-diphosphate-sugar epimerase